MIRKLGRDIQRKKVPKLEHTIKHAKKDLEALQCNPLSRDNNDSQLKIGTTTERIRELERKREGLMQLTSTTKYALNAECISKYWSKLINEKKPRDLFFALHCEGDGEPQYETRSNHMAELA